MTGKLRDFKAKIEAVFNVSKYAEYNLEVWLVHKDEELEGHEYGTHKLHTIEDEGQYTVVKTDK